MMPGGFPNVRFVASPDEGADTLYECNVSLEDKYVGHDGFDAGAPTWSAEPGAVGGVEGYRTLTFSHYINADPGIAAIAFRDLARILLASDAWLRVQMTASSPPVWFRTWRSTPGGMSLERVMLATGGVASGKYAVPLTLTADPFAVGALLTLATGTVNNDPVAGTNPNVLLLGAPVGDAAAPAVVTVDKWATSNQTNLIQITTIPTGYTAPYRVNIGTGDALTTLLSVGSPATDSTAVGGSHRQASLSGTGTWEDGTTVTTMSAFDVELPDLPAGDYLVYVRLRPSDTTAVAEIAMQIGHSGMVFYRTLHAMIGPDPVQWRWLAMGLVQFPVGVTIPTGMRLAAPTVTDAAVRMTARRTAGAGGIDFDAIALIPSSPTSAALAISHSGTDTAGPETVDSEIEDVYKLSGGAYLPTNLEVAGGFPYLHPGQAHALHRFEQIQGSAVGDRKDASEPVTVSYRPRYLWMQP